MIYYQNIYHMLAYAFQVLNEQGYKNVKVEKFENTAELLASILCRGVSIQIKRGLMKEYIEKEDVLTSPKGRIEISDSIKTFSFQKKQLVCTYDEFSINAYYNRIIKTTFAELLKNNISKERKKEIKKLMVYFNEVELLNPKSINWNHQYNQNSQTYHMLISICYMVIKGLLQTTTDGAAKLMDFLDEQRMCRLYEKFILEYYKKHYPMLNASASQISWALDGGMSDDLLPIMQSDVLLSYENKVLIIDAKYYAHTTQVQYEKHTIHSQNLYQIFTYVKNKSIELGANSHVVSGMLLYAKTDEDMQPNRDFMMSGNRISVRTLDLNCDFEKIKNQLNQIVDDYFEI